MLCAVTGGGRGWGSINPDVNRRYGYLYLGEPVSVKVDLLNVARCKIPRNTLTLLQHAPARLEYDGFPGYPIQPLARQIQAIELLSAKPVVAVTINHEGLPDSQIPSICAAIQNEVGLPAFDVLRDGAGAIVKTLKSHVKDYRRENHDCTTNTTKTQPASCF